MKISLISPISVLFLPVFIVTIELIKKRINTENYRLTMACFEQCVERRLAPKDLREAILAGAIIETYAEDKYGPGCLICGRTASGRTLHVQIAFDPVLLITAYDPTTGRQPPV